MNVVNVSLSCWQTEKCGRGTKPCLLFCGEPFDNENEYKKLKNILIGKYVICCIYLVCSMQALNSLIFGKGRAPGISKGTKAKTVTIIFEEPKAS